MRKLLLYVGLMPLIVLALSACSDADIEGSFLGPQRSSGVILHNLPPQVNSDTSFYVGVAPLNDIQFYQYKFGLAASIDCSDPTNYMGAPDAQTAPLFVYTSGEAPHKLCVVGQDSAGSWQPYDDATVFDWVHDVNAAGGV